MADTKKKSIKNAGAEGPVVKKPAVKSKPGEKPAGSGASRKSAGTGKTAKARPSPDKKTASSSVARSGGKAELPVKTDKNGEISLDAKLRGDRPMSVIGHLDEFRSRILRALLTLTAFTLVSFFISDDILKILNRPFTDNTTGLKLNIFTLTGGFIIRIKASVLAGIILALPVFIYQLWKYIAPAISVKDRKFSRLAVIISVFLFYTGIAFVFFGMLPFAIPMLLSFIEKDMLSTIGASDYLSFVMVMSLAMGVLFELPIIIMILTRIGMISPAFLIRKRKYSILLIWIFSAIITPPDVLTQIIVAVPLMILYEISILISRFITLRKNPVKKKKNTKVRE